MLIDSFGRVHNNLRLSVTDRCNLRCTYCMPEDVTFLDRSELLSFEELTAFTRIAVGLGITKVRLTGGEPLVRADLHVLVAQLLQIAGLHDIGLTTNAVLLQKYAAPLYAAGLRRLNISLDTLDPAHFEQLTRRAVLPQVLRGIDAAVDAGFVQIKINAVAIRGFMEHDAVPLAHYCRERGFELRFIEYMPIGAGEWERSKLVSAAELLDLIDREVCPVAPAGSYDPTAPAMEFDYADGRGKLGIIASVTRPFCHHCNRLRLTAEGKLRNCLFALDELDAKPLLRHTPVDEAGLRELLHRSVAGKWAGHQINAAEFVKPRRTMHLIGG